MLAAVFPPAFKKPPQWVEDIMYRHPQHALSSGPDFRIDVFAIHEGTGGSMLAHRVLVLEDNPAQALLYEKILAAGRYEVQSLADPLLLVRGLDEIPLPHAILLDLVLPEMDGLTVISHLESHVAWALVPIIVMTASPTRDRVATAQRLPVPPEGFLAKPVDPRGMLKLISAVISAEEPILLLRKLQRSRLSLRLGLRQDLDSVEKALAASRNQRAVDQTKLVEMRRNLQSLRILQPQVSMASLETRHSLQQQILVAEAEADQCRRRLLENGQGHKAVVQKRHEILCKQRRICDLERQIQAISLVVVNTKRAAGTVLNPSAGAGAAGSET